jgi:uncharacterized protein (TIGR02145 family)
MRNRKQFIQLLLIAGLLFAVATACDKSDDPDGDTPNAGTVKDADGNVYKIVTIGTQVWMEENLKTTKYRNDKPIEYPGNDNNAWQSNITGSYAWHNNDIDWKDSYGALYNWHAVNNSNGLCPNGWHVPSDDEWTELLDYVAAQGYPNEWNSPNSAGNALRSCRQVSSPLGGDCATSEHPRWNLHNIHYGTDEFGFSALPGGFRNMDGSFFGLGLTSGYWSSTQFEFDALHAWDRTLVNDNDYVYLGHNVRAKGYGFSVRCVRD